MNKEKKESDEYRAIISKLENIQKNKYQESFKLLELKNEEIKNVATKMLEIKSREILLLEERNKFLEEKFAEAKIRAEKLSAKNSKLREEFQTKFDSQVKIMEESSNRILEKFLNLSGVALADSSLDEGIKANIINKNYNKTTDGGHLCVSFSVIFKAGDFVDVAVSHNFIEAPAAIKAILTKPFTCSIQQLQVTFAAASFAVHDASMNSTKETTFLSESFFDEKI